MKKELYLYSPIYDFVAESLISQIEENSDNEITIRSNTPGGSVFSAYGICAKMQEHGNVSIKVDGNASSMGAWMLLYAKKVECLDVSTFILHRADMMVCSPEDQKFLDSINKDLKSKMLLRFDKEKFKEATGGITIDEMFNSEKRIDIQINAKQAKAIGLVQKVHKLTPEEATAYNTNFQLIAATAETQSQSKPKTMTLSELKVQHPAIYAEAAKEGAEQEKARIEAWAHFVEVDAKAVKEGIASGKTLSQAQTIELMEKKFSAKAVTELELDSEGKPIQTPPPAAKPADAKKTDLEAFKKEVLENSTVLTEKK